MWLLYDWLNRWVFKCFLEVGGHACWQSVRTDDYIDYIVGGDAECRHSGAMGLRYVQRWIYGYETVFSDTTGVPDHSTDISQNTNNLPEGAKRGNQDDVVDTRWRRQTSSLGKSSGQKSLSQRVSLLLEIWTTVQRSLRWRRAYQ